MWVWPTLSLVQVLYGISTVAWDSTTQNCCCSRLLPDRDDIVMCCDCYVSTVPTAMQGDGWSSVSISFMMNMSTIYIYIYM